MRILPRFNRRVEYSSLPGTFGMIPFILRRLVRALILLFVYQFLLFFLIQAMPGDFVSTLIGLPPPLRHGLRTLFGLDDPLWKQYLRWLTGFFTGNLGTTFQFPHRPVGEILLDMAPRTLFLFLPAALLSFWLGIWLGKHLGFSPRQKWFRILIEGPLITLGVMSYNSFPIWLAFVMVQIFAIQLRWFPAENVLSMNRWSGARVSANQVMVLLLLTAAFCIGGSVALGRLIKTNKRDGAGRAWARSLIALFPWCAAFLGWHLFGLAPLALDLLWHLALPLATVVIFSFGETMLLMRLLMRQQVREDYVSVARAKGLSPARIRDRHLAPLAIMPLLTRFLIQLPFVLMGSVVIETAFFWKGMGSLLLTAIDVQDIPVIMAIGSVVGVLMLIAHSILDIVHAWLDPRVRNEKAIRV